MKFLLSILVIIDNLNVLLANNNCRENDLNALMVRLRVLRTDFADLKIQHDEQIKSIAVLKEANGNQETELKKLRQEINNASSEIKLINIKNRKQDTELDELRHEIAEIKDKTLLPIVGFNARLSSTQTEGGRIRVVFDTVITNQGEGYNSSTGIFNAPYTGLYFFSVHVCSVANYGAFTAIYQEGTQLTRSAEYDVKHSHSCSSVSTIAMVNKAERVWVQTLYPSVFFTNSSRWNAFSGSLLNK